MRFKLWPMAEFSVGVLIVGGMLGWSRHGVSVMDAVLERLPPDQRLITAVSARDQDAFDAAIVDGATVKGRDASGMTALSFAAAAGNESIAQRLLVAGADVDAANNWGCTPLMEAATYDRVALVEMLLRNGADPTLRNRYGQTAEDRAREQGSFAAIAVLDKWAAARVNEPHMQVARSRIDLGEGL
jgi:ankyrin repeat protein